MNKRVFLQGFPVDCIAYNDAVNFASMAIDNGENLHIITINPEMLMYAKKDFEFANILKHAELIIADGVGIKIALRLKGISQERIGGVDFSRSLIKLCADKNLRLALLGAKEEVISTLEKKLKIEFPNLNIVFSHNGYFDADNKILEQIKQSGKFG